jgi:hypothetical protein
LTPSALVRHLAVLVAKAEINVRLAEVDRQQLGMTVGDVQQADIAELGQVIKFCCAFFSQRNVTVQTHAASSCNGHDLKEFPTIHAHFFILEIKNSLLQKNAQPMFRPSQSRKLNLY